MDHACAALEEPEAIKPRPSIQLAISAALSSKECEVMAGVIEAADMKVLIKQTSARSKTISM
jgi:hypothetical protein